MHPNPLGGVHDGMGRLLTLCLTSIVLWAHCVPLSHAQSKSSPESRPTLVGYFPQWALYDDKPYLVKDLIAPGGKAPLVNQINYAQGFVTNGRCSVADPKADLNFPFTAKQSVNGVADSPARPFRGYMHQVQLLKRRYPRLRVLISLEGRASDFEIDARPENREAFVASCIDTFIKGHLAPGIEAPRLFDGIDVDWEYPHDDDAENFIELLKEFRRQMDEVRPGLRLSIAVGHTPHMYNGVDTNTMAALVDQVGVMTYDFIGPWSGRTGLLAPLSASEGFRGGTVDRSIASWHQAGVPTSKLLMGVPFYAYGWRQVPEDANGLFQEGEGIRGDRPYRYIQSIIGSSTVYRDKVSQAPWLFDGDAFWTYDDPVSVGFKASYARDAGLGGLMIWELGDDDSAVLLRAAHKALNRPRTPISLPVIADEPLRRVVLPVSDTAAAPVFSGPSSPD